MGRTKELLPQNDFEAELAHFIGSEARYQWSALFKKVLATEGAMHVADKCNAFWLLDKIAATILHEPKVKHYHDRNFFNATLTVLPAEELNAHFVLDDGNNNVVFEERFWTDFPYTGQEFYVGFDGTYYTIMLKSEN